MNKYFCLITWVIIFILFEKNLLFAQQLKSHEIGRLWDTKFPTGAVSDLAPLQNQMTFPGGDFFYQSKRNLRRQGLWIGVTNWTDEQNIFHSYFVAECGPYNGDALEYATPISNKKYVLNRLPVVYVNDNFESRLLDSRSSSLRDKNLPADEKITTVWTTRVGITVTRHSYTFAHQRHDNYHIIEYFFQNTGNTNQSEPIELENQDLQTVYFGFFFTFVPSGDWGHQQAGAEYDDWVHYYGNAPADTLRGLWYCYDGDNQKKLVDDIGDPDETTGEFLSPQYIGAGLIHVDASADNPQDDPNQPATINWWPDRRFRSHTKGDTEQELYAALSAGVKNTGTDETAYRHPWEAEIQHPTVYFTCGPYDLPFGAGIKIVLYKAGGMISRKIALQAGKNWKLGNLQFNEFSGDAAKNALIHTGRDSLFQAAARAESAWQNGLRVVPDGPPPPDLNISAGPGKIELQWEAIDNEPDPDTGELDFAGYRVFRAVEHYTNQYEQIWECGGTSGNPVSTTYIDYNVRRGINYYYYVVAFDQDGHESSHFYNRNYQYGASPFLGARSQMDSVFVVPNPYHAQGLAFGGTVLEDYREVPRTEDRMYFMGLPYRAKIRIFTAHGDLVRVLEHPDPADPLSIANSADRVWHQISVSWQTIKSGVYFYHVEGWDRAGNYLGTTTGKFVVIR